MQRDGNSTGSHEELADVGIFVAGTGLKPSAEGKRIACDGPGRIVFDGPFAQPGESGASFSTREVRDMDEAVA